MSDRLEEFLATLDDEEAEETLLALLARRWGHKVVEWIQLGKAVEEIDRELSSGRYGQAKAFLDSDLKRHRMLLTLKMIYQVVELNTKEQE